MWRRSRGLSSEGVGVGSGERGRVVSWVRAYVRGECRGVVGEGAYVWAHEGLGRRSVVEW